MSAGEHADTQVLRSGAHELLGGDRRLRVGQLSPCHDKVIVVGALELPGTFLAILAAHPDDCVIVAGELALETRARGGTVEVVYLTCGSGEPGDARARRRQAEAEQVWGSIGVPAARLHFIGLPESPLRGPSRLIEAAESLALECLRTRLASLPVGAVVVLPAAGESHVDHRTLRRLGLIALRALRRSDLFVLEAPEYNNFLSLRMTPSRALAWTMDHVPLVGRWSPRGAAWRKAGFASVPAGDRLVANAHRLERKCALLRGFVSEDGEKLVQLFGAPDRFRRVSSLDARDAVEVRWPNLFGVRPDAGTLALWVAIVLALMSIGACAAYALSAGSLVACAALVVATCAYVVRPGNTGLRRVFSASLATGTMLGVLVRAA